MHSTLTRLIPLLTFLALLLALGRTTPTTAADTHILINELHLNPAGDTEFSEFIEIYYTVT